MDEQAMMKYGEIIGWVLGTFAFLKASSTFLKFVAEKTKNKWDNKLSKGLAWVVGLAGKIIDQLIGNSR